MKPTYYVAPVRWSPESPNPYTADGSYGPEWSCFKLRDEDDSHIFNGRPEPLPENADESLLKERRNQGPYCFLSGRGNLDSEARYRELLDAKLYRGHKIYMPLPGGADRDSFLGSCFTSIETRLADFLRYETSHGRKIIVSLPPDMDADDIVQNALANTPERRTVRPDDPKWWVHSTTLENWEKISKCGELRSFARIRQEKGSSRGGTGFFAFGEPADYAEYVMLACVLGIAPEHVVSSQQKGYLITEEDTPYTPGVRLYFDGHRIIHDGLAVSDGLHLLKVYDHLPLDPYLVAVVSTIDVDPDNEVETWTPWTFLNRANECFASEISTPKNGDGLECRA